MSQVLVCALDDSAQRDTVAHVAIELAEALALEPVFVHAVEDPSTLPPGATAALERARQRRINQAQDDLDAIAGVSGQATAVQTEPRLGDPVDAVLAAAEEHEAEYIVIGSRGLGPLRSLLSPSTSNQVLQRSNRPVVVVPSAVTGTRALRGSGVICGVDGSATGEHAAVTAVDLARSLRLPLALVHARPSTGGARDVSLVPPHPVPAGATGSADATPAALADAAMLAARDDSLTGHFTPGPPHEALALCAEEQDAAMIVVGRQADGRGGIRMIRRLARRVAVPIVSVPLREDPQQAGA